MLHEHHSLGQFHDRAFDPWTKLPACRWEELGTTARRKPTKARRPMERRGLCVENSQGQKFHSIFHGERVRWSPPVVGTFVCPLVSPFKCRSRGDWLTIIYFQFGWMRRKDFGKRALSKSRQIRHREANGVGCSEVCPCLVSTRLVDCAWLHRREIWGKSRECTRCGGDFYHDDDGFSKSLQHFPCTVIFSQQLEHPNTWNNSRHTTNWRYKSTNLWSHLIQLKSTVCCAITKWHVNQRYITSRHVNSRKLTCGDISVFKPSLPFSLYIYTSEEFSFQVFFLQLYVYSVTIHIISKH